MHREGSKGSGVHILALLLAVLKRLLLWGMLGLSQKAGGAEGALKCETRVKLFIARL